MIERDWLRLVPGCESGQQPLGSERLGSGTAHQIWRVCSDRGDFVLRAPDPTLPRMLTTQFERELQLQQSAAVLGLAPRIVAADSTQQLLVMDFIAGAHLDEAQLLGAPRLAQLLSAMAQLHGQAKRPPLAPLDPLANAAQFAQQVVAARPGQRSLIERRLEQAGELWRACLAEGRAPAVIHCDLHVGNIIARSDATASSVQVQTWPDVQQTAPPTLQPLVFLDWEYAAVGDPLLDYAALVAQYPAAEAAVGQHLLQLAPSLRLSARSLASASAVFALLSWLWWQARALQRPDDIEANRQMLALEQRLDPSLEQALGIRAG